MAASGNSGGRVSTSERLWTSIRSWNSVTAKWWTTLSFQSRYREILVGGPAASTNDATRWLAVVFGCRRSSMKDSRMKSSYSSHRWCWTSRYMLRSPRSSVPALPRAGQPIRAEWDRATRRGTSPDADQRVVRVGSVSVRNYGDAIAADPPGGGGGWGRGKPDRTVWPTARRSVAGTPVTTYDDGFPKAPPTPPALSAVLTVGSRTRVARFSCATEMACPPPSDDTLA